MRLSIVITFLCLVPLFTGCGKTRFGGLLPSEGDQASSGTGQPAILRKAFLWTEEATSSSYATGLAWDHFGGDWEDANGDAQGDVPFVTAALVDDDTEKVLDIDVTSYVARYGADFRFNQRGGTSYEFYSREHWDVTKRPQLVVERGPQIIYFDALADTTINRSTTASRGAFPTLNTADGILLRFNVTLDASVTKVSVRLHATTLQYGDQFLELYRP